MKKLGLRTITLSTLLLLGCGGGSSDSDSISNKIGILIYQNIAPGVCESANSRNAAYNDGYRDFILKETSPNTTCSTYGKSIGSLCQHIPINTGNVNCILAFNNFVGTKSTENTAMYETFEILESELQ